MNQKKNQGYQNTHRKIKNCVNSLMEQKALRQITVSEVCLLTSVNRSTFYAHFQDIYDVISQIGEDLEKELVEMYAASDLHEASVIIAKDYLRILLEHTLRHRFFYRAMLNDPANPVLMARMKLLKDEIISPLFDSLSVEPFEGDYYFTFSISGFVAVMRQWINANCPETPGQLADILFTMMPRATDMALDQEIYFQKSRNDNS